MNEAEYPRVTFALFGYNQERFIAEAIQAAIDQDYPNLEIIISDDCSSDRTFEVMERMAESAGTGHQIILNRTEQNLGTLNHVLRIAERASGELMIMAAGDDISRPERTRALVETRLRTGAWAVGSNFDIINEDGRMLRENIAGGGGAQVRNWCGIGEGTRLVKGAIAAWDIRLFRNIPYSTERILHEDIVLNLNLMLHGEAAAICPRSLVSYRRHTGSVANRPDGRESLGALIQHEKYRVEAAKRYLQVYAFLLTWLAGIPGENPDRASIIAGIRKSLATARLRVEWPEMTFFDRAMALWNHRSAVLDFAPRFFGDHTYAALRLLRSRLRSSR